MEIKNRKKITVSWQCGEFIKEKNVSLQFEQTLHFEKVSLLNNLKNKIYNLVDQ